MMKVRHNKKRNTAFVYEALIREITVAVIKNDSERKEKAISILRKHFKPACALKRHLDCYRSLYETTNLNEKICEKILREAKLAHRVLDPHGLFISQTDLIDDVNKELSPSVFNNFVPNYKTLASIYQIFSGELTPKNSVILETQLVKNMSLSALQKEKMQPVDNIVLTSFVTKFNEKYDNNLSENQRQLLNLYILSFTDNSLELKSYLNEEISRLKNAIGSTRDLPEFQEDKEMEAKAAEVVEKLQNYSTQPLDKEVLSTVLKTQELVRELCTNGDND
jgi:hypothetical protein